MKRRLILTLLIAFFSITAAAFAGTQSDNSLLPTYEDLKKIQPQDHLHQMSEEGFEKTRSTVLKNLDPRCLSSENCRMVYSVFYTERGIPVYRKVISENGTPTDEFYCEQAIWENVMPGFAPGKEMVYEFRGGPNNDFGEHPELLKTNNSKFVTLHLIPQHFNLSELLLPLGTVSASRNVLRLDKTKLTDPRLTQFRLEWFPVWTPPTSPQKILDRAADLRKEYSDLFS